MKKVSPVSLHADYLKRLRYRFDFRRKYPLPDSKSEHVRLFKRAFALALFLFLDDVHPGTKTVSLKETTH